MKQVQRGYILRKFKLYGVVAMTDLFFCYCRDIQASSILLDDKYEVRLGSLSEVCTQEGESHQSKITRLLRLPQ